MGDIKGEGRGARARDSFRHPQAPIRGAVVSILVLMALVCGGAPAAEAGLLSGLMRIVSGIIEIPRSTLVGTFSGPPIVGTVGGVLAGAFNSVTMVVGGVFETVASLVPLAMKAAPLIPIFI